MKLVDLEFIIGFDQIVRIIDTDGNCIYLGKWGLFSGFENKNKVLIDLCSYKDMIRLMVR